MIGVIGTSHKSSDLPTREAIARALSSREKDRSVLLLTCNRAEWYFSTLTPARTHQEIVSYIRAQAGVEAACLLYTFFGFECFQHLGRVVAGLDSLFVGETEIQGQVKAAYEEARKERALPSELHFLFQRSLRTGKVLRGSVQLPLEGGLCDQVAGLVVDHMGAVSGSSALLIGTSMVNRRLAGLLHERDVQVTYANRTFERAQEAAGEIGGKALSWTDLFAAWTLFPCVVAATRSSEYLPFPRDKLPSCRQLLIDLGVPRNIDPALASGDRRVVNIDAFAPTAGVETSLASRAQSDFAAWIRHWG